MKRIAIKWTVITAGVLALAVIVGALWHAWSPAQPMTLLGGSSGNFSISGPPASGQSPVLYPGKTTNGNLPIQFTNPMSQAIYVTSVTVTLTPPQGCSASDFTLATSSGTPAVAFSGSPATATLDLNNDQLTVASAPSNTATYNATLALTDNGNQTACAGGNLVMTYSAKANYTLVTATTLSSTQGSGESVTLTAHVTAPGSPGSTPGSGDGSVQFFQCTSSTDSSSCTQSLGTAQLDTSGTATVTSSYNTAGAYYFYAVYQPANTTDYVESNSGNPMTQAVSCVAISTASAATIGSGGSADTYNGDYEVKSGSTLWLNGGTINGNVKVDGGGQFVANGGTITGNVQSQAGGPVVLSGTKVSGNVQTQNAALVLGPTTSVNGNVQAMGGGPFCSTGNASAQPQMLVTIKGNLTLQSLTSTTTSMVCGTTVGSNLQWQSNSEALLLGTCGANKILGNLLVQSNSGKLTLGASASTASNAVTGNIQVSGNSGGGTLLNNTTGGNCQLVSDNPVISGSGNTAKGQNKCNASA